MTTFHFAHSVLVYLALCLGAAGGITDLRSRVIPNRLTVPAMMSGLLIHLAIGGWVECGRSLAALVSCGGIFFVFYLAGGMGAGDVKMIAAEASLLGLSNVIPLLVYTALCGGIMGLILAIMRGRLRETLGNMIALTSHHSMCGLQPHPELNVTNDKALRLPYALAIGAGALLIFVVPMLSGTRL